MSEELLHLQLSMVVDNESEGSCCWAEQTCMAAMGFFLQRRAAAKAAQAAISIMFISSVVVISITRVEAADPNHLVTNLPGAPAGLNLTQYAGYVTVNETHERALFYWFFQADHPNASSKPLIIWLNGGPGCSSVGNGLLAELGPFFLTEEFNETRLSLNPSTWIKEANIIFLESPVAVGFSYSNTSSDYSSFTDKQTADDSLQFLLNWYEKFPEYKANDFYLVGESYAGHYIPTFAKEIVHYNDVQRSDQFHINFKGYAVGNPWTDAYFNNMGATEWWHTHDIISDEAYESIMKYCNFSSDSPVDYGDLSPLCVNASLSTDIEFYFIDPYSIYTPVCNSIGPTSNITLARRVKEKSLGFLRAGSAADPCSPDLIGPWLNSIGVKQALHVRSDIDWSSCADAPYLNYSGADIVNSMLPIYQELINRGLRIWIYNGDTDSVCPTTASRYALKAMDLEVEKRWYPWEHETQVGGHVVVYKGLTFVTVRDAGHFVPSAQPGRGLALFKHFLAGTPLPDFPQVNFTGTT